MKRVILCLLWAAALAGCGAVPPAPPDDNDYAQAAAVERVARHNGVQVIWVNYPRRTARPSN